MLKVCYVRFRTFGRSILFVDTAQLHSKTQWVIEYVMQEQRLINSLLLLISMYHHFFKISFPRVTSGKNAFDLIEIFP